MYNFGVRHLTLFTSYTLHRHHTVLTRTNPLEYISVVTTPHG